MMKVIAISEGVLNFLSPLPSREGARGRGFSRLDRTQTVTSRRERRVWCLAHSRADARRPLPLPPSRKGRGDFVFDRHPVGAGA
jgi:hypothetical protein